MPWHLDEGLAYLAAKDARMAAAIDELGGIHREGHSYLFTGLAQAIIGQQISLKAAATVEARVTALLGSITAEGIAAAPAEALRGCGMSERKVAYLKGISEAVLTGQLDFAALEQADDETCIRQLSALRGVGRWTAEMLLIFNLRRQDVMSYDDLGLRSGLCRLYHHQDMPRARFERYCRRFSPYGTAASLVLWEIAGGRAPKACAAPLRPAKTDVKEENQP